MKFFAQLFRDLDETNSTNEKVEVLIAYFNRISDEEKVYALALFTGRRPKRLLNSTILKKTAMELANVPEWLFEESYSVVGDLAETISLLLPNGQSSIDKPLSAWMLEISAMTKAAEIEKLEWIVQAWNTLSRQEIFVLNKILTGSFRLGVSQILVIRALSKLTQIPSDILMHRISGDWNPATLHYSSLLSPGDTIQISRPFPFCLAYPIDGMPETLGEIEAWQAEWKWDGIRAQLIHRNTEVFIWSRGEELITENFPELAKLASILPHGCVLDGELVCMKDGLPLPFQILQTRINRKKPGSKMIESFPAAFIAYDVLEYENEDLRPQPLLKRREILENIYFKIQSESLVQSKSLVLSEKIQFTSWEDLALTRALSREKMAEGLMLKRYDSVYATGRRKGDWWKWKIDPYAIDAVLIYAQKGHGRRADLYTDYTFAVWDNDKLVSFAKAYSGLTDKEIIEVDRFVKANTLERFGPVRTVKPELVFEIGFEGIGASNRHKSGIAIRFPRILRWRKDKKAAEADTLESLKKLMIGE